MKIKHIVITILIAVLGLCFTGCDYCVSDEAGVERYLRDNGFWFCSIEDQYVKDEEGTLYWNIHDNIRNIDFQVVQIFDPGGWMAESSVFDNYDVKYIEKHLDDFPEHEGVEIDTEDIWSGDVKLIFEYTDVEDLEKKYEVVKSCAKYIHFLSQDVKIAVHANYSGARAIFFENNSLEDFNEKYEYCVAYEEIKSGKTLDEIKNKFFAWGYEYRFQEVEAQMSDEDIKYFWEIPYNYCAVVYHSGDPEDPNNRDYDVHEDIYFHGDITFGNLYYLLTEEGFDVDGTVDDFTVKNLAGESCRFSYSFVGKGEYGTYYLVNDEEVSEDVRNFRIYSRAIKDLFGLDVEEYRNKDKINILSLR